MNGNNSQRGVVKWYSWERRYGFITRDDGTDVFFYVGDSTAARNGFIEQGAALAPKPPSEISAGPAKTKAQPDNQQARLC